MSSIVTSEVWAELKRYINTVDRQEAAETLVAVLIDHDESAEDIRDAFKHDSDVKRALMILVDNNVEEDSEEDEEESDIDDNERWEN